ncbi:MAG TPA: hypothetical protein VL961_06740, partial [Acidimicrobiales bacterium]|nr:hypothetical protein [Acidimicrobiales bacterium]
MPENIEASLNWPEAGLAGVPKTAEGQPAVVNGADRRASATEAPLAETLETLTASVQELVRSLQATTPAGRDAQGAGAAMLDSATMALNHLEEAASSIARKLDAFDRAVDEHVDAFGADLFGSGTLSEEVAAIAAGKPPSTSLTQTWAPPKRRTVWSRFTRSNIAFPLLLVAVIA